MENNIQNIGKLNYLLTILTGKNRQVRKINLKKENKELEGDYIISIGKKAVILTEIRNNQRIPIIVKNWKEVKEVDLFKMAGVSSNINSKKYKDTDGLNWIHSTTNYGSELLVVEDENGEMIYDFVIK